MGFIGNGIDICLVMSDSWGAFVVCKLKRLAAAKISTFHQLHSITPSRCPTDPSNNSYPSLKAINQNNKFLYYMN